MFIMYILNKISNKNIIISIIKNININKLNNRFITFIIINSIYFIINISIIIFII